MKQFKNIAVFLFCFASVSWGQIILRQPASATVGVGKPASFSISVLALNPSYQWQRNDVDIIGETKSSYTISAVTLADSGEKFRCIVTAGLGSVTSNEATLTVISPPTITTDPTSQTVNAGTSVTFSVVASGTGLSYQWKKGTTNISGATSAIYTIASVAAGNAGSYQCVVTNVGGSATSAAATLTVNSAPVITTQPVSKSVTAGASTSLTVVATGTPTPTYQWQLGGTNISGATSATYSITSAAITDTGTYQCIATNSVGSATSNKATLTVNIPPTITTDPVGQIVTAGQNVTFTVVAAGTPTPTLQWKKGTTNILGATSSTYSIAKVAATDAGTYQCVATNTAGTATSAAATLTVNSAPSITTQPSNLSVTLGKPASFTVAASGNPAPTYQWQLNGNIISGATSATYSITSAAITDTGTYQCIATNSVGSATSNKATLTVNIPPTITTDPVGQIVTAGQNVTFTVVAAGTPTPTLQWKKGTTNILGATSSTYIIAKVAATDAGTYQCVATNTAGTATSAAATLMVNYAPAITTQPSNLSVTLGKPASFTVAASGNPAPTYQWQLNGNIISGATLATYSITSAAITDTGTYQCIATNSVGSATSNKATLIVNIPPTITTDPVGQIVTAPATATFSVTASGTPTPTYQWQKGINNVFSNISGAGAQVAAYTTPATSAADNGSTYRCVVTNVGGSATSAAATLTVNSAPSITTQPSNLSVTLGKPASFTVVATGTAPLSYQWQLGTTPIGNATSATYNIAAAAATDTGDYTCVITNSFGNITTQKATLTVNIPPTITTDPVSQTVTAGQNVTFTVAATGTTPFTYQWQKGGVTIGTASTYIITGAVAANAGTYQCIVSNTAGADTSKPATLTVNTPPTILTDPSSLSVYIGASASFTVSATGTGTLSYQWQKSDANGNFASVNSPNGTGANSATYTISSTAATDAGQYRCSVSSTFGTANSKSANLTVNAIVKPTITTQPKDASILVGGTVTFSIAATGTGTLTYQWQKYINNVFSNVTTGSGYTTAYYTISGATSADAGTYQCLVSNSGGATTSNAATLSVGLNAPTISLQPYSQTIAIGKTATFTITAAGSGTLSYQWQKNGGNINGATSYSYTTPTATSSDDQSKYQCIVYNSAGGLQTSATSSAATLTVVNWPYISTQPSNAWVIVGNTATFTIKASGYNLSYQWFKNGGAINNSNSASYTTPQLAISDNGAKYTCNVSNIAGTVSSNGAVVTVTYAAPVITASPGKQTAVEGTKAIFLVTASGSGLSYQWYKTDKAISGATSAACTTATLTMADNGSAYKCIVSNSGGSDTSASAALTVTLAPPKITVEPVSQTAPPNNTVNFSINATGSSLTYKWQKNLVDIAGATAASYITPAITLGDNGAKFRCIVSNASGADTSVDAVLTVNAAAPTITTYPTNQTVTEGQKATFAIGAIGLNLVYQWKRNDSLIANANASIYTTPATSMTDNGAIFSCVVGNLAGTVTSNSVVLTVNMAPPVINLQPQSSQTVSEGASASLSITATGTNCSYQWQKNDTNIIGANSPSYTTPTLTSGDNGTKFRCVVSNAGGSVFSNEGLVLVATAAPVIVTNPANDTVSEGSQALFTVSASGSNLSYQWLKNGAPISANATNFAYTIPAASYADNGALFQCIVTNPGGKATSASAKLTVVIAAPQITIQPQNQSARVGTIVNFSVTATGSNLSYQWQQNNVAIANATGPSYSTLPVTAADDGATFKCIVSNSAGSVTSNQAALTININAPLITTQPADQTADAGKTVSFSIVASGGNLSYQWQENGIDIPNAASATYTTPAVFRADSGATFRCVVTNAGGSIFSNQAILSVNTPQFTLSIGNTGNGQTSPFGKVVMYYGDSMDIKAIANQSYRFSHWQTDSGSVMIIDSASPNTRVICSKSNATITAYFSLDTCTLSVSSDDGGHVNPSGRVTVGIGSVTIIKAIADIGFCFDHWSGVNGKPFIVDSTSDSTQVALLGNAEVRAVFSVALCKLTVKTAVPPDTAITVLDTMIMPGDTVPLVAPKMLGTAFIAWRVTSGSAILLDSSVASTKLIAKSANVTVVAVFGNTPVIVRHSRLIPSRFALRFQQSTGVLYYDIPRVRGKASVAVKIRLFDARGRLLKTLQQPALEPGYYHVTLFGGHVTFRSAPLFEVCVMESEGFKKAIAIRCIR